MVAYLKLLLPAQFERSRDQNLTLAVPADKALVMAMLRELHVVLPYCPALKTLFIEACELDTGSAGLERVRAALRCAERRRRVQGVCGSRPDCLASHRLAVV